MSDQMPELRALCSRAIGSHGAAQDIAGYSADQGSESLCIQSLGQSQNEYRAGEKKYCGKVKKRICLEEILENASSGSSMDNEGEENNSQYHYRSHDRRPEERCPFHCFVLGCENLLSASWSVFSSIQRRSICAIRILREATSRSEESIRSRIRALRSFCSLVNAVLSKKRTPPLRRFLPREHPSGFV